MTVRKAVALVAVLLIGISTLSASQAKPVDLTGVWKGTLNRTQGTPGTAYLDLKQTGADLTGSAGPDADRQSAIAHGKIATVKGVTSVTFDSTQSNGSVMAFDLKVDDGRLKGNVKVTLNGETRGEATLDVGREKK